MRITYKLYILDLRFYILMVSCLDMKMTTTKPYILLQSAIRSNKTIGTTVLRRLSMINTKSQNQ